jgi:hypothetical protein
MASNMRLCFGAERRAAVIEREGALLGRLTPNHPHEHRRAHDLRPVRLASAGGGDARFSGACRELRLSTSIAPWSRSPWRSAAAAARTGFQCSGARANATVRRSGSGSLGSVARPRLPELALKREDVDDRGAYGFGGPGASQTGRGSRVKGGGKLTVLRSARRGSMGGNSIPECSAPACGGSAGPRLRAPRSMEARAAGLLVPVAGPRPMDRPEP